MNSDPTSITGTAGNDDIVFGAGADTFVTDENAGIDVIVNFDPVLDSLRYLDRGTDGFDDLKIVSTSYNGDHVTLIGSNDQVTVLYGVQRSELRDANFTFTDGPRGRLTDGFDDGGSRAIFDFSTTFAVLGRAEALAEANPAVDPVPDPGPDPQPEPPDVSDDPTRAVLEDGTLVQVLSVFDDTTDTEVVARFFDPSGERVAGVFVREDSNLNFDPVVTALGSNRLAVAWTNQDDDDFGDIQVLIRTYRFEDGRVFFESSELNFGRGTREPSIATLENGNFVVAVERGDEVLAAVLTPDGNLVGDVVTIADTSSAGSPTVTASGDGFAVDFTAADGTDARATFDADGSVTGTTQAEPEPEPEPEPPVVDGPQDITLAGTAANDRLDGTRGDDRIAGGNGNDRLAARNGDDVLFGEDGNDRLFGGGGDDVLIGGEGRDVLNGGNGADVFVFGDDSGRDTIRDFGRGDDLIVFVTDATFDDLAIRQLSNGNARVDLGDTTLILRDTDVATLDESDFRFADDGDYPG